MKQRAVKQEWRRKKAEEKAKKEHEEQERRAVAAEVARQEKQRRDEIAAAALLRHVRARATMTTYDVHRKPGKTEGGWSISDKVNFDGAIVIGADFTGVTFLKGFTAQKARFENGADFRVSGACPSVGASVRAKPASVHKACARVCRAAQ